MVHSRSPWIFKDLVHELDRMSRNTGWMFGPADAGTESTVSGLKVDENEAFLTLDLPGVSEADLELVLENNRLRIEARRDDLHDESEEVLLRERTHGEFVRELKLPWPVRDEDVEASLKQGILRLSLKRAPETEPRKIKITSN